MIHQVIKLGVHRSNPSLNWSGIYVIGLEQFLRARVSYILKKWPKCLQSILAIPCVLSPSMFYGFMGWALSPVAEEEVSMA